MNVQSEWRYGQQPKPINGEFHGTWTFVDDMSTTIQYPESSTQEERDQVEKRINDLRTDAYVMNAQTNYWSTRAARFFDIIIKHGIAKYEKVDGKQVVVWKDPSDEKFVEPLSL